MTATPPPPLAPSERPAAPPFAEAAGQIMVRQIVAMARGRRLLVAALLAAVGPALVALVREPDPAVLVRLLYLLVLPFLLPLVAISLGSGLLYDDAEEGTLTFLFTAPVSKAAVLLGKWCAALATGWALSFLALGATFLLTAVDLAPHRAFVRACWVAILLGFPAYLGLFSMLGVLFRRGFLVGLIYAFAFELVLSFIPGAAKRLSIAFFVRSLVDPHSPDRELSEGAFAAMPPDPEWVCITVLLGVALLTTAAALYALPRKEFQARNVPG